MACRKTGDYGLVATAKDWAFVMLRLPPFPEADSEVHSVDLIPASRPTCGFSEPSMQKFQFAPESRAKSQGSASEKEANQKCS